MKYGQSIGSALFRNCVIVSLVVAVVLGCSAPRQIVHSGKVTPKGHVKIGTNTGYNISTAAVSALFDGVNRQADSIAKSKDTIVFDAAFNNIVRIVTIWSIDPLLPSADFYVRYGIFDRFDIGYSRGNSVNVLDARGQFLGPLGAVGAAASDRWYGSAGIQFSWQNFELPSYFGNLQEILKYSLKRKDILIPVVMSYSFGPEEKYGALGLGAVGGVSFITYEFDREVYELIEAKYSPIADVPQGKTVFPSVGMFANIKAGYKVAYALAGMAIYYQNYGTYRLYKGQTASYSGVTIVPTVGVQLAF
jgi:hypothetical protein